MKDKKIYFILILLFLLSFFVRLLPVRIGFHFWDECVYLQHAEIISGFRQSNYDEFHLRPPLLALMIAIAYKLHHSLFTAHLVVAFISALGTIFTFILAKNLFDEKIALLASLIFLASPLHIQESHRILVDALLPTFWTITSLLFLLSVKTKKLYYSLFSGIFLGLSILLKFTSFALFIPFACVLLLKKQFNPKHIFIFFTGFIASTLIYFIYSYQHFGSPFYSILLNMKVPFWGKKTPCYIYFITLHKLLPYSAMVGIPILFFFLFKNKRLDFPTLFLLCFSFIPFSLFHITTHQEPRYILPTLPFFSILSAKGLFLGFSNNTKMKILSTSMVLLFLPFFFISLSQLHPPLSIKLYHNESDVAIMQASLWIKENPFCSVVYSNFNWPVIAFYSKKKIVLLPLEGNFQNNVSAIMKEKGCVVVSSSSPRKYPELEFLYEDKRFKFVKKFQDREEEVYIFTYSP